MQKFLLTTAVALLALTFVVMTSSTLEASPPEEYQHDSTDVTLDIQGRMQVGGATVVCDGFLNIKETGSSGIPDIEFRTELGQYHTFSEDRTVPNWEKSSIMTWDWSSNLYPLGYPDNTTLTGQYTKGYDGFDVEQHIHYFWEN